MCGIAGVIGKQEERQVRLMLNATIHRGPDDHGIYTDEFCTLGMNRLSVIDVSQLGHQPMYSDNNRYVIVYNGEIYNYLEIRATLSSLGYKFRSNSDTEVVLKAYEHYGKGCLEFFRGMFAFAIWDIWDHSLFAARDHFGIKPFYYTIINGKLIFCSEVKGFYSTDAVIDISYDSLSHYLSFGYISHPHTIYNQISSLLPGYALEYKNGNVDIWKYWQLERHDEFRDFSYFDTVSQGKKLIISAVREQMVSDVPLGVFLSGGLDSAVQVASMRHAGVNHIKSFSVGFDDLGKSIDEGNEAKVTSIHFDTEHYHLNISKAEVTDLVIDYLRAMDQPTIDGLNTYIVSKYASKQVTVALSGLGADELFGGYTVFKKILSYQKYPLFSLPLSLIRLISSALTQRQYDRLKVMMSLKNIPALYSQYYRYLPSDIIKKLLFEKYSRVDQDIKVFENFSMLINTSGSSFQQTVDLFLKTHMLSRLLRDTDVFSMAHSLEVRVPFLDTRISDFAYNTSPLYHFKNYLNPNSRSYEGDGVKRILYDAFKEDLPADFGKRKKSGFSLPFEAWMKSSLKSIILDTFHSNKTSLSTKAILDEYKAWCEGRVSWTIIWTLFVYVYWHNNLHGNDFQH